MSNGTDILGSMPGTILFWIGTAALAVNLPLGYLRGGQPKFSFGWFVYVHLSVPLIAWLRITNHVGPGAIPLFILCAVAGQLAGGRMRRAIKG